VESREYESLSALRSGPPVLAQKYGNDPPLVRRICNVVEQVLWVGPVASTREDRKAP